MLLRSLHLCRFRTTPMLTSLLLSDTYRPITAAAAYHGVIDSRNTHEAFASNVNKRKCCCSVSCRCFHVTSRCDDVSRNVDNDTLSEKLCITENFKPRPKIDDIVVKSSSVSATNQLSLTKEILKSDIDIEKKESRIRIDESKRKVVVYVDNAFVETKATELYKYIRKMPTEQVWYHICII